MKTIQVSEATYNQLKWLVAKCEGAQGIRFDGRWWRVHFGGAEEYLGSLDYTGSWSLMGPIIEREGIDIRLDRDRVFDPGEKVERWYASKPFDTIPDTDWTEYGATPLIAAACCYVVSKLGETVEVPEELT